MKKTFRAIGALHSPGLVSRFKSLAGKTGHFAFMIALVFRSAALLPHRHPMTNPANIGRYGVSQVIAAAADRLVMKRENVDQVAIFGAVVAALVMVAAQAVIIGIHALVSVAHAETDAAMFTTAAPETDFVFGFLGRVFGVDMFGTATPVQAGLHAVLGFYSTAMMAVAAMIVVYYVVVIVGESAQTGTPFGRRFNGLWAPIRLVLALGLLVPIGGGLNTAQYMILHVAKFGSSLASNAWSRYADTFTGEGATCNGATCASLGGTNKPTLAPLGQFIFGAEACRAVYNSLEVARPVRILAEFGGASKLATFTEADIPPAGVPGSLRYVWSVERPGGPISDATCGSITMEAQSRPGATTDQERAASALFEKYQAVYIEAMGTLVEAVSGDGGDRAAAGTAAGEFARKYVLTGGASSLVRADISLDDIAKKAAAGIDRAQGQVNAIRFEADYASEVLANMREDAKAQGWGSAGGYYLELAKVAQARLDAARRPFPQPAEESVGKNTGIMETKWYAAAAWSRWQENNAVDREVQSALSHIGAVNDRAMGYLTTRPVNFKNDEVGAEFSAQFVTSNPVLALGKYLFGDALLRLMDEPTVNPMARLVQAGSDILDRSERMIYALVIGSAGGSFGTIGKIVTAVGGGVIAAGSHLGGSEGGVAIGGLVSLASIAPGVVGFFILQGLLAGIILFYVLPLLPFMYFFFAVVNWVIEVAEAFIAAPLFALSHLRIDGDGLPGQTAYMGWLTLFGVLLRPVLIVLGLIVATLIHGGGAYLLTQTYRQAIFSYRGDGAIDLSGIGQFGIIMYVLLFVYLAYILTNSVFKLIDTIPDKAMRWLGGQQPFTGERPVDVGNMKAMAVAGYGVIASGKEALSAAGGTIEAARKNLSRFNVATPTKDSQPGGSGQNDRNKKSEGEK